MGKSPEVGTGVLAPALPVPCDPLRKECHAARQLWLSLAGLLVLAAITGYRLHAAARARFPGHADPAFYYSVARNLHGGRGASIDYVWQFLAPTKDVSHYAFDYWLPLPSLLMSVALFFDTSLTAAIDVSVMLTAVFAVATYLLAWRLTRSWWIPTIAGVMVATLPLVSLYSVRTESSMSLAAFVTLAFAVALGARQRPVQWVGAGVLTGLAGLTRNDGLWLIAAMVVAVVAWNHGRDRIRRLALLLGGYAIVMAPFVAVNVMHFGAPLPPSAAKFPYIVHYQQIYSLNVPHSTSILFSHRLWLARLHFFPYEWRVAEAELRRGVAVTLAVLVGLAILLAIVRARSVRLTIASSWLLPITYCFLVLVFDALANPIVAAAGAVDKTMVSMTPVAIIGGLQCGRTIFSRIPLVGAAGVVALAIAPALTLTARTDQTITHDNRIGSAAARLGPALAAERLDL